MKCRIVPTFVTILIFVFIITLCRASGTVCLKLSHYDNPGGTENTGNCCELHQRNDCGSDNTCDNYFIVCLDEFSDTSSSMNQCRIGKYTTGVTPDKDQITFGKSIGGTPNPKEYHFRSWQGGIHLKLEVWDHDGNEHDLVESFRVKMSMEANRSRAEKRWHPYRIKKRTQLDIKVAVFCDENYYGPRCDVYCKPSNGEDGHSKCTSDGRKQCLPGIHCEIEEFNSEAMPVECKAVGKTSLSAPTIVIIIIGTLLGVAGVTIVILVVILVQRKKKCVCGGIRSNQTNVNMNDDHTYHYIDEAPGQSVERRAKVPEYLQLAQGLPTTTKPDENNYSYVSTGPH